MKYRYITIFPSRFQWQERETEVWVSTDNEQIANISSQYGAKVHNRASYAAIDEASSLISVQEFVNHHTGLIFYCI